MSNDLLGNLRRKLDYYEVDGPEWIRSIWNKQASFDWFLKCHRKRLIDLGGLHRLGRDYFIDRARFPSAAELILGISSNEDMQARAGDEK